MAARRTIIDTYPPEHTKLRKVVASTFSQRAVAVYEHFITGLTEEVLDRMPAPGQAFDFVDTVAKEVPIRVLAQVMGLPAADLDLFIDLGDRLIATAREISRTGRSGIYDVRVTVDEISIAELRGHSRTIGGAWVPAAAGDAK